MLHSKISMTSQRSSKPLPRRLLKPKLRFRFRPNLKLPETKAQEINKNSHKVESSKLSLMIKKLKEEEEAAEVAVEVKEEKDAAEKDVVNTEKEAKEKTEKKVDIDHVAKEEVAIEAVVVIDQKAKEVATEVAEVETEAPEKKVKVVKVATNHTEVVVAEEVTEDPEMVLIKTKKLLMRTLSTNNSRRTLTPESTKDILLVQDLSIRMREEVVPEEEENLPRMVMERVTGVTSMKKIEPRPM